MRRKFERQASVGAGPSRQPFRLFKSLTNLQHQHCGIAGRQNNIGARLRIIERQYNLSLEGFRPLQLGANLYRAGHSGTCRDLRVLAPQSRNIVVALMYRMRRAFTAIGRRQDRLFGAQDFAFLSRSLILTVMRPTARDRHANEQGNEQC